MMTIDINASSLDYPYNQSPINAELLLAEINAQEVKALYPVIFFYAAILIIGIIGNSLVLLVYSYRYKRSPARLYILFLAAIDFSICLFGLPYHLIDLTHPYTFTNSTLCKSLTFIMTTLFHMSIFGLIVIAVDRYLKICRPLQKIELSHMGRRRACVLAVIFAVALSWPQIVLYGPSEMETPVENVSGHACFIETHYFETNYPFIYIMSTLIVCVVSTIFLILTYSLICRQICIRYRNDVIQIQTSAYDLEDPTMTDDISLKSYTISVNGKHAIRTSPLARSIESVHKKSDNSLNKMEEMNQTNSRVNICVNPYDKISSDICDRDADVTETCKLMPNNTEENNDKRLCVKRQRSYSLDGFDFKTPLKPEHTYVHYVDKNMAPLELHTTKPKEIVTDNAVNDKLTKLEPKNGNDDRTSHHSQSSKNSSTNELFPNERLGNYSNISAENKPINKRLDLPRRRFGSGLFKDNTIKRRYSENLGNKTQLHRNQRSRSMAIGNLITNTHFGDGLRIHTCNTRSDSVTNSSNNSAKPPKLSRKHSKITKIMLTITSVFILSYTPSLFISIYSFVRPEIWDSMTLLQTVISEFCLRFYLVNNICNPFIYGFWDKRFTREIVITLKKIFGIKGSCGICCNRISFDSLLKPCLTKQSDV